MDFFLAHEYDESKIGGYEFMTPTQVFVLATVTGCFCVILGRQGLSEAFFFWLWVSFTPSSVTLENGFPPHESSLEVGRI